MYVYFHPVFYLAAYSGHTACEWLLSLLSLAHEEACLGRKGWAEDVHLSASQGKGEEVPSSPPSVSKIPVPMGEPRTPARFPPHHHHVSSCLRFSSGEATTGWRQGTPSSVGVHGQITALGLHFPICKKKKEGGVEPKQQFPGSESPWGAG